MTILDLAIFLGFPGKAYHACTALMLAKLYSNSLLALFNSRAQLKTIMDADEPLSFFQSPPTSGDTASHRATGPIVFEDTSPSVISMQGQSWIGMNSVETGTVKKQHKLAEES